MKTKRSICGRQGVIKNVKALGLYIVVVSLLTNLTWSCKVTLAPEYNSQLVETLESVSIETFRFMAQVSDGVDAQDYSKREETYNTLIGVYESLKLRARSRPKPKNELPDHIKHLLSKRTGKTYEKSEDYPSVVAFEGVIENLKKMKQVDKTNGLTSDHVDLFKSAITIYLDQALTYENFLKR